MPPTLHLWNEPKQLEQALPWVPHQPLWSSGAPHPVPPNLPEAPGSENQTRTGNGHQGTPDSSSPDELEHAMSLLLLPLFHLDKLTCSFVCLPAVPTPLSPDRQLGKRRALSTFWAQDSLSLNTD